MIAVELIIVFHIFASLSSQPSFAFKTDLVIAFPVIAHAVYQVPITQTPVQAKQ